MEDLTYSSVDPFMLDKYTAQGLFRKLSNFIVALSKHSMQKRYFGSLKHD